MKNSFIKLSIVLVTTMLGTSCSFLDVETEDIYKIDNFYSNEKELKAALNGVYAVLGESALYGQMIPGRMGLWADLGYNNYSVDRGTVSENAVTTSDAKIKSYWQSCYKGINNANLLIENIDKASSVSKEVRKEILGQAKFLRAYYYLMLTSKFGDVPLRTKFVTSTSAAEIQLSQTPSKEIYEYILSEMDEAAEMVADITQVMCGGVISKSAVWGIEARACLYNAGYPNHTEGMYAKALDYAKRVIDVGYHSLNQSYQQVFINYMQDKYDTHESILEVEFYGNNKSAYNSVAGQVGRLTGPRNRNLDTTLGYCVGSVRSTGYHYSLYDDTDLRRDWNIVSYYYDAAEDGKKIALNNLWGKYAGKFRREYELVEPRANDATPTNFPLLRYSDVLLMFAEAYAADIDAPTKYEALAYECFNQVRRRGHGSDIAVPNASIDFPTSADKTEFLMELRNERARELAYEMLRKDDLVRWGIFYQHMKSNEVQVPSSVASSSQSNYNYAMRCYSNVQPRDILWPIPAYEMSVNSNLVQNTGW